jgi:hypothetical protein
MSTQKFNSQTGYSADINNITSKVRLDFNTNVVNPTNAILGVDDTCTEFVLLDNSLLPTIGSDGTNYNANLSSFNKDHEGTVRTYVFEKLIDPSVVGCENCGDKAQYYPTGVNSSGQITDDRVLPVINKDVIAEFEILPEAYHSFEIDLVGHRRICDDSGNCFYEKANSNPDLLQGRQQISWLNDLLLDGFNITDAGNEIFKKLFTDPKSTTAHYYANTNPSTTSTTQFPPYNAPTQMDQNTARSDHNVIDYSCCKCCSYYEDYNLGKLTLNEVKTKCGESNVFGISRPDNDFFNYCTSHSDTTHNRFHLNYNSQTIDSISTCTLIKRKLDQYGTFPNQYLPQCLNSTYIGLGVSKDPVTLLPPSPCPFDGTIVTRCCGQPALDVDGTPIDIDGDGEITSSDVWDTDCCNSDGTYVRSGGGTCPNACDGSPCVGGGDDDDDDDGGGGPDCVADKCAAGCPFDCGCYPANCDCFPNQCSCNSCFDVSCEAYDPCVCIGPCYSSSCPGYDPCGCAGECGCSGSCGDYEGCQVGSSKSIPIGWNNKDLDESDGGGSVGGCQNGLSRLHEYNTTTQRFGLGRCVDAQNGVKSNLYKVDRDVPCSSIPNSISNLTNYCAVLTASNPELYWKYSFDDVSWLLLGGHFYANKQSRDLIYNQGGTIHFSTSVNSNLLAYKPENETHSIYHIEMIDSNDTKYKLHSSSNLISPSFYDSANAFISLGYGYSSTKADGTNKESYPVVKKYTYYEKENSQNYLSEYRTPGTDSPRVFYASYGIRNSDGVQTSNIVRKNITGLTPNVETAKLINSDTNANGRITDWPKTNKNEAYTSVGRQSHQLNVDPIPDDTTVIQWDNTFNDKIYHNTITPTDTLQLANGSTYRNATSAKSAISYKNYLVNNSIRQDFAIITDSRDFASETQNYENYKFFGRVVDNQTVEITNGNAIADPNGNVQTYSSTSVLSAKILKEVLDNIGIGSTTDPKVVTINACTSSTISSEPLKIKITETNDVFDYGTLVSDYSTSGDLNTTTGKITIKLDRKYTNFNTEGTSFVFMFKVKSPATAFTDSITYDKTGTFSIVTDSDGDPLNYDFNPVKTYLDRTTSLLHKNEFELFTINSARFATADYASYDGSLKTQKTNYDQHSVPMRGLQYAYYKRDPSKDFGIISEVDDYPIIRTIRKNDGKFYVQILAGAFPYHHPLVHEPLLYHLGYKDYGLVWRNRICNRTSNWYNYLATTKWTCYVKHTQFGTNIPGWTRVNETSESGTGSAGKKPIIIGQNPRTAEITAPNVPQQPPLTPDDRDTGGRGETQAL